MRWFMITLDSDQIMAYAEGNVLQELTRLLTQGSLPSDYAVFAHRGLENNVLYFSPSMDSVCADLFRRYNAVPCGKPDMSDLHELSGSIGSFRKWRSS